MFKSIQQWMRQYPIPSFFILTFLIAWSIWLPLGFLAPKQIFLSLLGAWAPTISAVILIGLSEGKVGLQNFWKRIIHWRVGLRWYFVVLFGIAIIAYFAIFIGKVFGTPAPEISAPIGVPQDQLLIALPLIFLINIFFGGPLAEDIGWRGYILPKMYERTSALSASIQLGIIWAIWHLPYFIFPAWRNAVGNTPFVWFMLLTTAWSVLFAWIYINTESILMPVLFHAAINTTLGSLGVLGQSDGNLSHVMLNTLFTWLFVCMLLFITGKNLKFKN